MTKVFLRKLLIAFSGSLLLIGSVIYACGGWDYDWDYTTRTNFTPEVFTNQSFSPLFLSEMMFYKDAGVASVDLFNDAILSDWSGYLNGKIDDATLRFFLLDSSATDINDLHAFMLSKKQSQLTEKWRKKINLDDKKTKAFLTFLYYGKQVETASVNRDYWAYDTIVNKTFDDEKTISEIKNTYKNTPDKFLKNRYWFQTMKAYFYSNEKQRAVDFFNNTEKDIPKNALYYRALSYVAGVHYKMKNYAAANYLYSRVFDKCPELRIIAAYSFHPQEETDWKQSLAMANNNEEKAALWAIRGYYGDEKEAIKNIFALNPKSEHLEFLLTRLINREEMKTDKSFRDENGYYNDETKSEFDESAAEMVINIANSQKAARRYLWYTAAGYLQTIKNNFDAAYGYFDKAEAEMPKTDLAKSQLRLLRLVNYLSKADEINTQTEQELLPELVWLYGMTESDGNPFRFQNAVQWSKNRISKLYDNKNAVMSELFWRKPDFYQCEDCLQNMKIFLKKEHKSDFEKMALKLYNVSLEDIYEYESIEAAFQNKIPEAIAFAKQTGALQNDIFYGNPFLGNIKDCHDCDHAAPQKRKFSVMDFLTVVREMQDKVSKSEDLYNNYLLLGNAFYNITYFGNARLFYESNIAGFAYSNEDYSPEVNKMITDCSLAKMYYTKALAVAKTDEQRAKCQYMMAKCERNDYDYGQNPDAINFFAWNSFKILKSRYSKTKYYKEVIAECGYFRTFLEKSN